MIISLKSRGSNLKTNLEIYVLKQEERNDCTREWLAYTSSSADSIRAVDGSTVEEQSKIKIAVLMCFP
jgi:hypothetical protein